MSGRDPGKRIPKSLGTDAKLFGRYTLSDLAVALLPGVVVILLLQVLLPASVTILGYRVQAVALPLAGVAILLGGLFVALTPAYTTSLDWLGAFLTYQRSQRELAHDQAKQYTHVERVHPDQGAIERVDGGLVGLVAVEPPSMALATDAEWAAKAAAFQDFCNTIVEFPIQVYSPTQAFPVEEYLAHYDARLRDPDVQTNPRLEALITQYVEWYRRDLVNRRMTIREHYVVVSVTPREVQFQHARHTQTLARIPLLGAVIQAVVAPHRAAERAVMFEALADRLGRVETGLREIDGCTAHQVDALDATRLVGEFWAGHPQDYHDPRSVLRTRPLIGGRQ